MAGEALRRELSGFWSRNRWRIASVGSFLPFVVLLIAAVITDQLSTITKTLMGLGMFVTLVVMALCYDRYLKE